MQKGSIVLFQNTISLLVLSFLKKKWGLVIQAVNCHVSIECLDVTECCQFQESFSITMSTGRVTHAFTSETETQVSLTQGQIVKIIDSNPAKTGWILIDSK